MQWEYASNNSVYFRRQPAFPELPTGIVNQCVNMGAGQLSQQHIHHSM
jgi:hypothetical protein